MVSLRPQTLPRPTSGAWYDFETRFDNLNLDLDIHWNFVLYSFIVVIALPQKFERPSSGLFRAKKNTYNQPIQWETPEM